MRERKLFIIIGIINRAFSVTWLVAIQIHWRKRLHKKEFNSHGTGLGHQHGGSDVIGTGKALILGATQLLFRRGDEHAFGAHNSQQLSKFVGTKQSFYIGLRKRFISFKTPTWPPFHWMFSKKHCKNRIRSVLLNVGSKKIVISQNRSNWKRYSQEEFCRDWSNNAE